MEDLSVKYLNRKVIESESIISYIKTKMEIVDSETKKVLMKDLNIYEKNRNIAISMLNKKQEEI